MSTIISYTTKCDLTTTTTVGVQTYLLPAGATAG
jgi:hypothetical protein